jgi:hypothetical protein
LTLHFDRVSSRSDILVIARGMRGWLVPASCFSGRGEDCEVVKPMDLLSESLLACVDEIEQELRDRMSTFYGVKIRGVAEWQGKGQGKVNDAVGGYRKEVKWLDRGMGREL